MVQTLLQQYRDIPDGTECHRKTYASTTLSGAAGERRPGPEGRGCKEVMESLAAVRGRLEGLGISQVAHGCHRGACGGPGTLGSSCMR